MLPTEGLLWMNVEHVEDVLHVNRSGRQNGKGVQVLDLERLE